MVPALTKAKIATTRDKATTMKRQLYTLSAINGTLPSQIQNRFGSKISMYIKLMENQLLWIIFFEKNENLAKTLLMPFLYPMRYSVPDGTIIWYHCNSYDESRRRSLKKSHGFDNPYLENWYTAYQYCGTHIPHFGTLSY